jgi:hypothetical protein
MAWRQRSIGDGAARGWGGAGLKWMRKEGKRTRHELGLGFIERRREGEWRP